MTPDKKFIEIGINIPGAEQSKMFGKLCFKVNNKAFACFFDNCMVFKLTGVEHKEAMSLIGAKLFNPSGKGRHMKEWVQTPYEHSEQWLKFAQAAKDYVIDINSK